MQRWLAMLCLVVFVSACQPLSVSTQSDPYTDFNQYQSFDWLPEKEPKAAGNGNLLEKQLRFAIERELQSKGIVQRSGNADFLISYYSSNQQKSSSQVVENASYWGDRGRYSHYDNRHLGGGGYSRSLETLTVEYKEGTLVLDFVDADSKQLIWQATVQGIIDEQDPAGQLDEAVIKALQQFPPSQ
ncbi:MAG: DUF4136 domain-containing protein [Halopseudomonas sp.]